MASKEEKELKEEDFIQEGFHRDPKPMWWTLLLLALVIAAFWALSSWRQQQMDEQKDQAPFLQPKNREFSLFLWQNPQFMRANANSKVDYLTGFDFEDKVHLIPGRAEEYVVAPPEVLFVYHTWKRLTREISPKRKVKSKEFRAFLQSCPEWTAEYWGSAPQEYRQLLTTLPQYDEEAILSLPEAVHWAFQGWKNFYMEAEAINAIRPSYGEVRAFVQRYPGLERSQWINISAKDFPDYLKSLAENHSDETPYPPRELNGLFRVLYYNETKAQEE